MGGGGEGRSNDPDTTRAFLPSPPHPLPPPGSPRYRDESVYLPPRPPPATNPEEE